MIGTLVFRRYRVAGGYRGVGWEQGLTEVNGGYRGLQGCMLGTGVYGGYRGTGVSLGH